MNDATLSIRQKFDYSIIDITGAITFDNAQGLKNQIDASLSNESSQVVLNLERVTFIDSTALALLIELMTELSKKKINFYLMNPNQRVEGLLIRANLRQYFRFIESEEILTQKAKADDLNSILEEPL